MTLETLIRPFQLRDTRPPAQTPAAAPDDPDALECIVFAWGAEPDLDGGPGAVLPSSVPDLDDSSHGVIVTEIDPRSTEGLSETIIPGIIGAGPNILRDFEDEIEDDEDEAPGEEPTLVFTEVWRKVRVVRVENPEDSEQYVDVEDAVSIEFKGPEGRRYRFDFGGGTVESA